MKINSGCIFDVALLAALISTSLLAHGQVRKCVGPDGKVTYSDFVCVKNTASETSVQTGHNAIDASGYRQEAQRMKSDKTVNTALQTQGDKCKFSYYTFADDKGKRLADAAKEECLSNIRAKALGQPTSLEAYGFWKDHWAQKSAQRDASITRAEAATNARNIKNAIDDQSDAIKNQTFTCKRGGLSNDLECKTR